MLSRENHSFQNDVKLKASQQGKLTTKCWKSQARITLVAFFGSIPRFCRFDPELLDKFELKSSLFESQSLSLSSELLDRDKLSAKTRDE